MFEKTPFAFDAEQMMDFFKSNDFTKAFTEAKLPDVDTEALFAAQKKNLDALVEANKAAAAGYQELFRKQLAIFESTLSEAQAQMKDVDLKMDSQSANAKAELAKAAFETALANMKDLADTAQKANTEAYEIVSGRVKDSVEELKDLAGKMKG